MGLQFPPTVYSDGKGTVQSVNGSKAVQCKRRQVDIAALREALEVGDVAAVLHLPGVLNPVDPLTKDNPSKTTTKILEDLLQGSAPSKQ